MNPATFRDGYIIRDQHAPHFLTFSVCGWIDLFTRQCYRDIVLDSFQYCRSNKGLLLHAYVIMSNHVHLIMQSKDQQGLSDTIRDFKKFTSKRMLEIVHTDIESRRIWMLHQFAYYGGRHAKQQDYQIWTNNNHPEAIYTQDFLLSKLNYTHQNPVRAGWVSAPENYLYSSASNYQNGTGLIDVDLLF